MAAGLLTPKIHWGQRVRQGGRLLQPVGLNGRAGVSLSADQSDLPNVRNAGSPLYKKKFRPHVIVLFGRRGQGKTLWQTSILAILRNRHLRARTGYQIFTNYWVSFADVWHPMLMDNLKDFPAWANHAVIALDEIADLMPSARAMGTMNLLFGSFLRQIRKRNCDVIAATQFPQEISRTMLRQVDFFVECEIVRDGKGVKTYWWDWWGQYTGNLGHQRFPPEKGTHDHAWTLWGTDQSFGHYRTEEVIGNLYSEKRGDIIAQQYDWIEDVEEEQETQDQTFEEMVAQSPIGHKLFLSEVLPQARAELPAMRGIPRLSSWLSDHGWHIGKEGGRPYAVKL